MTTEQMDSISQTLQSLVNTSQMSFEPMSDDDWLNAQLKAETERRGDLDILDGYNCEECKNKGYIPYINADKDITYRECKCKAIRKQLSILEKSGLKDSVKKIADFETPEEWQAEIKTKAINFIKQRDARCFYIGGQSGAGKTHICSGIAREYIKKGKDTRYIMWVDMVERLKDYEQREQYARKISDVDILYIDDFFKPTGSKAEFSRLDIIKTFEIIDRRYKQPKKITIISSELTVNELAAIDTAIAGRITEMAKSFCYSIKHDEKKNYRKKFVG